MASSTSLSHPLSLSRNRTIGPLQAALEGIMACTGDTFDRTSPPPSLPLRVLPADSKITTSLSNWKTWRTRTCQS